MQLISYTPNKFVVAAERTEGIPEHAVEIEGDLIEVDTQNLNGWGVKSSAVDEIIENGLGIPVRICNSPDPHECDYNEDHFSDIGYVTKLWKKDNWINARAAITDKAAITKIKDGTWMPFNEGDWSVSGYPGNDYDDDYLMYKYIPMSIAFIMPPNKPAYEGSKFELVAAAVKNNKLQSENIIQNIKEEIMADEKDVTDPVDPTKTDGPEGTKDVKTEQKEEPKAEPKTEPKSDDVTMYTQEDFDKKLAESLETQKLAHEEQLANMTPNGDLETMLSAAKKETIDETLDKIKREKLTDEYMGMLKASAVLSAPFMIDGKLDESKLISHGEDTKMLSAAIIETKIDHAKAMVAAMPAGNTAFDAADIPSKTQDNEFNAKVSKLGVTSIDFSRGV